MPVAVSISSTMLHQDVRELAQGVRGLLELEEHEVLGGALHVVEDVVEVDGDRWMSSRSKRGDEARVQGVEHLAGDQVPVVLDGLQLHHLDPPLLEVGAVGDLHEELHRLDEVLRCPGPGARGTAPPWAGGT